MSDTAGGTTYQYDQLSRLLSETRTFAGLAGTYTLAYTYNFAGQLKSLTDHTQQRINYSYDNAALEVKVVMAPRASVTVLMVSSAL